MTGKTPDARTGRSGADIRRATRPQVVPLRGTGRTAGSDNSRAARDAAHAARQAARRGTVVGANALQIDEYAEVLDEREITVEQAPAQGPDLATTADRVDSAAGAGVPAPARARTGLGRLRVAPPMPVAVPRAPFLVLLLVIVVAGVFGVLLINTKINENAFTLDNLQNSQSALDQQEAQLAQNLTIVEAPGNLAAAARRLGLVPAGSTAVIRLPDGRVLSVPEPASGPVSVTAQND
ncbi:hypothetical protein GCM10009682_44800 [Luedemannella flava]|uniref:Cell division protein FtsL n=1 Tax=Luedemannella flava TaxID=349316 RepID=A0ABN2MCY1_9ACTN